MVKLKINFSNKDGLDIDHKIIEMHREIVRKEIDVDLSEQSAYSKEEVITLLQSILNFMER